MAIGTIFSGCFLETLEKKNICLCYNNDRSGSNLKGIFHLGILLSSLMNLHPGICGRLVVSQKYSRRAMFGQSSKSSKKDLIKLSVI